MNKKKRDVTQDKGGHNFVVTLEPVTSLAPSDGVVRREN